MMVKGRPKGTNANSLPRVPQLSVWAQCDNQNCQKWRRLPPGSVVDDSVPWFCYMNPDELRNSCEAPEESYNEDIEDYQLREDPSVQISSDEEGTHGSWRGGGTKRGAKRKHGASIGGGRGRGRGAARQPQVKPEPQHWAPAPAPGAKRQRTSRSGDDQRVASYAAEEPQPFRLQSEASLPGSAQKLPRGSAKVIKAHGAFQKLLAGAGTWDVARGRTQAVQVPPHHVWEGMAQYAPEAAELACHSLDIASAESYFARPGAALREGQHSGASKTARLAVTMAAAAAADSAAGTFHASTSQSSSQAAQGPLLLHTLAGLPTGQAAALPGSAAVASARPALVGPAQGLLSSLGLSPAMPASFGVAAAAAQHAPQALSTLQGSGAPLSRAPAPPGQASPAAGEAQSNPMSRAGVPPALGSQAPGRQGMSSSGHMLGTGLPSMPEHASNQPTQRGGAAGALGDLHGVPAQPGGRYHTGLPGNPPSNPSIAHFATQGVPVKTAVHPHTPGIAPPALLNAGQLPVSASLGNMTRHPASNHGAAGVHSHAGLPAHGPTVQQGTSQHPSGAALQPSAASTHGSRLQRTQQSSQQPHPAARQMHDPDQGHLQKSAKQSESSLLEVQADSSGNSRPDMNGHPHSDQPRRIPNGVYEHGALREGVSKEHEHARSEHGHAAAKGRPPEVEAGYS